MGVGIKKAANILEIPRSRFYKRDRSSDSEERSNPDTQKVTEAIKSACDQYPLYGYRSIRAILKRKFNIHISLKQVNRLMKKLGLTQNRIKNRRIVQMKDRPAQPTEPNQVWEMDMTKTYLNGYGWLYIMAIIDRFDRSIVGYEINSRCRAMEWLSAFDKAIKNRFPDGSRDQGGLVLQVDNGCQPTSKKFIEAVKLCDVDLLYSAYATPEHNAHIGGFSVLLKKKKSGTTCTKPIVKQLTQ
jgi:putative transposase